MITADFFISEGHFRGFSVSGHANAGKYGHDIVCAGVSSAVMLTMNTLTDFMTVGAKPRAFGGRAGVKVKEPNGQSDAVIASLEAHLRLLAQKAGGGRIKIVRKTYYTEG